MKKYIYLALLSAASLHAQAQHYTSVKSASETVYALRSDSTLWGWGNNMQHQLGLDGFNSSDTAMQIMPSQKWLYVGPGSFHTLGIAVDGTLWGWGYNLDGELGSGTNDTAAMPVQVSTAHWAATAGGMQHSLALRNDGTLWATGWNYYGNLGLGDTINRNVFTQVGTDNDWKSVSAGGGHSTAIKNNGSLWAWGYNGVAELGTGNLQNANAPVQVGADTDWVAVAAGFEFTIALKSDGSVWSWGFNGNGQLGRSISGLMDSVPHVIPGLNNVRSIAAGASYAFAIKQDGTLWGWGFNALGQLGISSAQENAPIQVGTDNDWAGITAAMGYVQQGGSAVFGTSSAGFKLTAMSICTAGSNYIGQLGNGTLSGQTDAQSYFDCSAATIPGAGVATIAGSEVLSVYPNPATDNLYISLPRSLQQQPLTFIITDASGKTVITHDGSAGNNINVSKLTPGIYFLQVADNKGHIDHLRFVKQ